MPHFVVIIIFLLGYQPMGTPMEAETYSSMKNQAAANESQSAYQIAATPSELPRPTDSGNKTVWVNSIEEFCNRSETRKIFPDCSCETPKLKDTFLCKTVLKKLRYEKVWSRITASVSTLVLLLAVTGNTLVIVLSIKQWRDLTHLKRLVLALAICDLTFAVAQFIQYFRLFWTNSYIYGRIPCKLLQCSITTGSFVAMSIILTIVMERFVGIVFPFGVRGYRVSNRLWSTWLFVNILIALAASIPITLSLDIEHYQSNKMGCQLTMSKKKSIAYYTFVMIFYTMLPTMIMIIAYIFIFQKLRDSVSKAKMAMISDPVQRIRRLNNTRRIVLVFLVVLLSFVILIFPLRIFQLYVAYNGALGLSRNVFMALVHSLPLLAQFHVAVNPIIYSVMDPNMRRQALKLFRRPLGYLKRSSTSSSKALLIAFQEQSMQQPHQLLVAISSA